MAELDERDEIVERPVAPQPDEAFRGGDRPEEGAVGRAMLSATRIREGCQHAAGRVDHEADAAARDGLLAAHDDGVGVGEREREERETGQEEHGRRMEQERAA